MTSSSSSPRSTVSAPQSLPSPPSENGSTDGHSSFDPGELTRLLKVCTPRQDEITARYEARAKRDHDRIIEMGGRPSRPVRVQPKWKATYKQGLVYITDNKGVLECTLSDDIDPMNHHWSEERGLFDRELRKWQSFRRFQQEVQPADRLEIELELSNTDARLIKDLTKLCDWQQFEAFQERSVDDAVYFEDSCRLELLDFIKWEVATEQSGSVAAAHEVIRTWLSQMDRCQDSLRAAKKDLRWIQDQWPSIVAEVIHSLSENPTLLPILEAKFQKQTTATFNAIVKLGGRPRYAIFQPNKTVDVLDRILHWSSETSRYRKELSDWKGYLEWRLPEVGDRTTMQGQEYRCPSFGSPDFFVDFENFRRSEYDVAASWLQCWQRVVRWHEEEMGTPDSPEWLGHYAKKAQVHMRKSEEKLADAAARLQKSMQEHAHALAEDGQVIGGEKEKAILPLPTPPLSSSDSPQSSRSYSSCSSSPSTQSSESSESSQPLEFAGRLVQIQQSRRKSGTVRKGYRRLKKEDARKHDRKMENIITDQQPLPPLHELSPQVEIDENAEMVDAQEDRSPFMGAEAYTTPESEDIVMADFDIPSSYTSSHPSISHSEPIPTTGNQTLRKIDSGRKVDLMVPGKVLKKKGKKPAKKAKSFTERQTMTLLNAATFEDSPEESPHPRRSERIREKATASAIISSSPISSSQHNDDHTCLPLRRSERLQEKAAASTFTPSSQKNADDTFPSSEQKHPLGALGSVKRSRPSRRRKAKEAMNTLEPPRSSIRKNSKIPRAVDEPSRPSRQKALAKQARNAAHRGR